MRSTCELCGEAPASLVTSRWHLGLIVYGRTTTTQAVLCRGHGRSLASGDLLKTVLLGWWGAFSFLIDLVLVPMQIAALAKAGAVGSEGGSPAFAPPPPETMVAPPPPPPPKPAGIRIHHATTRD